MIKSNNNNKDIRPPKDAIEEDLTQEVLNNSALLNWHHYDLEQNQLFGVSSYSAYNQFKLRQPREIIVAVIDGGVDIKHEDL